MALAVFNKVSLELSKGCSHVEHQPATRSGSVDRFGKGENSASRLFVGFAAMPYAQDEYREHVRLHVTNYAVVAHSVAPQASEVAGKGFSARVWISEPADSLHIVQDAF